jgi:hypothetical protein
MKSNNHKTSTLLQQSAYFNATAASPLPMITSSSGDVDLSTVCSNESDRMILRNIVYTIWATNRAGDAAVNCYLVSWKKFFTCSDGCSGLIPSSFATRGTLSSFFLSLFLNKREIQKAQSKKSTEMPPRTENTMIIICSGTKAAARLMEAVATLALGLGFRLGCISAGSCLFAWAAYQRVHVFSLGLHIIKFLNTTM